MPYLYLVRHAQPDFTGHYDSVTALGLQQSAWLGQHFSSRGLRFARTICGSLARQSGTLETMLLHLPGAPEPRIDAGFNEYDAARVLDAFRSVDERALRASGDRRAYFAAVRDALRAWASHDGDVHGGLESWQDFGNRVTAAADAACAGLEPSEAVLVVTSGGVIGRLVAETLGAGPEAAIQLNLQTRNTGVTELVRGRTIARLVAFNAAPHLERADRSDALTYS
jgi:broad specificity phosphatase PhoE